MYVFEFEIDDHQGTDIDINYYTVIRWGVNYIDFGHQLCWSFKRLCDWPTQPTCTVSKYVPDIIVFSKFSIKIRTITTHLSISVDNHLRIPLLTSNPFRLFMSVTDRVRSDFTYSRSLLTKNRPGISMNFIPESLPSASEKKRPLHRMSMFPYVSAATVTHIRISSSSRCPAGDGDGFLRQARAPRAISVESSGTSLILT